MMRTSHDLTVRIAGWLLVIATAVPTPVLAADSCGCAIDSNGGPKGNKAACCCCTVAWGVSEATDNCCQQRSDGERPCRRKVHSCCTAVEETHCTDSHCAICGERGCRCGASCQCRSVNEMPPAAPLAENDSPSEKVAVKNPPAFVSSVANEPLRKLTFVGALTADALAALQRCISLCRFTL